MSLMVAASLFFTGCSVLRPKKPSHVLLKGFASPESVVTSPEGDRFYVSNVGERLMPSEKDGDGFISEVSIGGEILTWRFLPKEGGLNAPKGMAIVDRTLYVTDVDRVVGFDLDTREEVFSLDLSEEKTTFLNDIAVKDDTTLFVSATDVGKVYAVSLVEGPAYTVLIEDAPGVNGLYYDPDEKILYTVGFGSGGNADGSLWVVRFKRGLTISERITGSVGLLDGVSLLPDGRVLFSDWVAFDRPGVLRTFDPVTKEFSIVRLSEEVRGPADFYFDASLSTVWLPMMLEGKVLIEKLDIPKPPDSR